MTNRIGLLLSLVLLTPPAASAQQAGGRLLSADNLSQVAPHVWVIKGFPNIGIVVGSKASLVIDTGLGTKNGQVVASVAKRLSTKGQKLYLTTTHYHAEHAAGEGGFPQGTVVIRPEIQQAELESEGQKLIDLFSSRSPEDKELLADARINPANILFNGSYQLDLGGVDVHLYWFGGAHTKGDEIIQIDPDSVLFTGDVVQNKAGPYFYCADCTPRTWLSVLNQVAQLPTPKIVVPDHSPPGDASLIAQERDLMAYLQSRIAVLKAAGNTADQATQTLTVEVKDKYPGWTGFNHMDLAVAHTYAAP